MFSTGVTDSKKTFTDSSKHLSLVLYQYLVQLCINDNIYIQFSILNIVTEELATYLVQGPVSCQGLVDSEAPAH